ncbi:hypothetical protein ACP4OV_020461 [Aristida adscensionis]
MGREAEPAAEEERHHLHQQQLLRRRRRLFAAEERSFRMDLRSPAASALRAAVPGALRHFLGSYSDDILVEYIVILICNGKHQYQARDDLEAFLGDDSENFVAWLWGYLSKQAMASAASCDSQHLVGNGSENMKCKKNLLVGEVHCGNAHTVNSKITVPQAYHDHKQLDSAKGRNLTQRCISSTIIASPERLDGDRCIWEDQRHKKSQNAEGYRSFAISQYGVEERTSQMFTQEERHQGEHLGRNPSTRSLPEAVETDNGRVPVSLKRRRNVWDRLGKPIVEDRDLVRETHDIPVQNGIHKKTKLMVVEHEHRQCVDSNAQHDIFDKAHSRKSMYTDANTMPSGEHVGTANRSRLIGRLSFDGGSRFHSDAELGNLQDRDVIRRKPSLSLPAKSIQSQSLNEFPSELNGSTDAVSEPPCNKFRPSKGLASASNRLPPLTMWRNSETEVLHAEHFSSPSQSKTPSSVRDDGTSCRNKPVKEEILDMKLKLKQMELNVLKLRSQQTQINNGKQGALSLGLHANLEEDSDSRTVLVINVHFAATKEALSMHFMKCGTVLKTDILTDAITGRPKGAAYITFADKESIDKAVSLSGTSFLARVLTVMRKANAPAGLLASVQQSGKPPQPWNSPSFQKGSAQKQPSSYHLQWKREQSVMEKSPASCATS